MQKGTIILGLSLLLTACDLGFPKMTVNYESKNILRKDFLMSQKKKR